MERPLSKSKYIYITDSLLVLWRNNEKYLQKGVKRSQNLVIWKQFNIFKHTFCIMGQRVNLYIK